MSNHEERVRRAYEGVCPRCLARPVLLGHDRCAECHAVRVVTGEPERPVPSDFHAGEQ